MSQIITFKRGSTFEAELELVTEDCTPVDIRAEFMTAQINDGDDNLISELTIVETIVPGTYLLSTTDDTSDWPLETIYIDIRAILDDKIRYSNTLAIKVTKQVTRVLTPAPEV